MSSIVGWRRPGTKNHKWASPGSPTWGFVLETTTFAHNYSRCGHHELLQHHRACICNTDMCQGKLVLGQKCSQKATLSQLDKEPQSLNQQTRNQLRMLEAKPHSDVVQHCSPPEPSRRQSSSPLQDHFGSSMASRTRQPREREREREESRKKREDRRDEKRRREKEDRRGGRGGDKSQLDECGRVRWRGRRLWDAKPRGLRGGAVKNCWQPKQVQSLEQDNASSGGATWC